MNELPKAHPTHHRGTMIGLLALTPLLVLVGWIGEGTHWGGPWLVPVLAGLWLLSFVVWSLIRVNSARCPECGLRMKHVRSLNKEGQQMEIFSCPSCHGEWSVPGVSTDG